MSFAEAREVLRWFVPQAPSTEVLEKVVLGLGRHTQAWFESVAAPDDDGEVLGVLIDGKCVPTARASELEKRRGKRDRPAAASPGHRGRVDRKRRGRPSRRNKGDKSKSGKLVTMVVMYTLRRRGTRRLEGPLNRRHNVTFASKRHAFEVARREATKRGFGPSDGRVVQLVTDLR